MNLVWQPAPPARLLDLAREVPAGPWEVRRSLDGSGALLVWDEVGPAAEPLLLVYRGGTDLAKYLCCCAPAVLLGPGL